MASFIAVPVGQVVVSMTAADRQPVDGHTADVAQALVTDEQGNPMANVSVTWSIAGSTTAKAVSPTTVMTDASGRVTFSVADTVVEDVTLRATAGGKSGSTVASFIAIPVKRIEVTMITDGQPADSKSADIAQAFVLGSDDKPKAGVMVIWSITSGSHAAAATSSAVSTDANGIATFSIIDSAAETVHITASAEGMMGGTAASFVAVTKK